MSRAATRPPRFTVTPLRVWLVGYLGVLQYAPPSHGIVPLDRGAVAVEFHPAQPALVAKAKTSAGLVPVRFTEEARALCNTP